MSYNEESNSCRVLVIGANGGIGKQCVTIALEHGHIVTAILRDPNKLNLRHPNLTIVKGDVTVPASFIEELANQDVVISALGVAGGFGKDKPTTLYSMGVRNILEGMESAGIKRAFFISASALEVSPVVPFFISLIIKYVVQKLLRHMYDDLRRMEEFIKDSDVNWTIIRPPQLTDKPLTGKYRIAINAFLKNCLKISRADVSHYIITNIENKNNYKGTVEIGY